MFTKQVQDLRAEQIYRTSNYSASFILPVCGYLILTRMIKLRSGTENNECPNENCHFPSRLKKNMQYEMIAVQSCPAILRMHNNRPTWYGSSFWLFGGFYLKLSWMYSSASMVIPFVNLQSVHMNSHSGTPFSHIKPISPL